jgi:hypothetical protein
MGAGVGIQPGGYEEAVRGRVGECESQHCLFSRSRVGSNWDNTPSRREKAVAKLRSQVEGTALAEEMINGR